MPTTTHPRGSIQDFAQALAIAIERQSLERLADDCRHFHTSPLKRAVADLADYAAEEIVRLHFNMDSENPVLPYSTK